MVFHGFSLFSLVLGKSSWILKESRKLFDKKIALNLEIVK